MEIQFAKGHVTFACVKKCKDYEKKEEDDD